MARLSRGTEAERSRSWMGGLRGDSHAQVSFSVIAVVLLIASAASGTYLAKREFDRAESERDARLMEEMVSAASEVELELSLMAASRAQRTVSEWSSFPVNESAISGEFEKAFAEYVDSAFPRSRNGFSEQVLDGAVGLYLVEKRTMDLVASDDTKRSSLQVGNVTLECDELPSPASDSLNQLTATPYYVAVGNVTIVVSGDDASISKDASFERAVVSALPFLESKLRTFESSTVGEFSDMGKLVTYMLTTLGQVRVLEGYGIPLHSGGLETADILTESDVHRAVAVALVLEQARLFRAVDPEFVEQVSQVCGGGDIGLKAVVGSSGRYVDPAELFLWFLGMTEPRISGEMMLAQTIAGVVDQVTVKVMEYMGWLGVMEAAADVLQVIGGSVDSVIEYLTGEDRAMQAVLEWIVSSLETVDTQPENCHVVYSLDVDFLVSVPERVYYVENAAGELYPVWIGNCTASVIVPEYDLLSGEVWREFYDVFKECQGDLRDLITDCVNRLAFDLAATGDVSVGGFVIDPMDGEGFFTTLASSLGDVDLDFDAETVAGMGDGLALFTAQRDLAIALEGFVSEHSGDFLDQALFEEGYRSVAEDLLSSAKFPYIADLVVPVGQQIGELVRADVERDVEWGVGAFVRGMIESTAQTILGLLCSRVSESVTEVDDSFAGPLVDGVAQLLATGVDDFPGLERMLESQLRSVSRMLLSQDRISGLESSVYLDLDHSFEFWDGDFVSAVENGTVCEESLTVEVVGGLPPMQAVPYDPESGYDSISNIFPVEHIAVQVRDPWQFSDAEEYPNMHLTSVANASTCPYSTQWTVSAVGVLELAVGSEESSLLSLLGDGETTASRNVRVEFCVPVVLHSAAPLDGVEYDPTNTLLSDSIAVAKRFCDIVWDKIEPIIGWMKNGLERVMEFVQGAFDTLSSFAVRVVLGISKVMQTTVELMQAYIQKLADSVLGKAVQLFIDLAGTVELRLCLYGFTIIIRTNLPDLLYKESKDLLRVMVHTRRFGPGITFGIRVVRDSEGVYDIVANGTLALRNATVDVVVDPLMHVTRRLVEVHCTAEEWRLDLLVPDVVPLETAEVSTADLPGVGAFLSNIPIPMLGMSASIKAGMRLKYSPPFATHIVVNEFEANPEGDDSGREWAELYNPLGEAICLDGWTLSTIHGKTSTLYLDGTIAPSGYMVFSFPGTSIDNGQPDDPFNDGDALMLTNAEGMVVDVTPILSDTRNDGRTHQRNWDGGPKWLLDPGSRGDSNGAPILTATADCIAKALFEAFREAFEETKVEEVTASLGFVELLMKRVLENFIENLLAIVSDVVHEVVFFIEVLLADATGSAGFGFRASFVVSGEAIVDLVRWLIHRMGVFVVNLCRANNPLAYPEFPGEFFEGLYLRFEVLFVVDIPRMLATLGGAVDLQTRAVLAVSISPNLPALGRLAGRDWGAWCVEFGAYLEGVPRAMVGGYMVKDAGGSIDLWLMRATVRGT